MQQLLRLLSTFHKRPELVLAAVLLGLLDLLYATVMLLTLVLFLFINISSRLLNLVAKVVSVVEQRLSITPFGITKWRIFLS